VRGSLRGRRVVLERPAPTEQLVGDDTERVKVAGRPGALARGLLGREVAGGPEHRPRQRQRLESGRARDPEVGHANLAALVHEQVRRLDVAVDDPVPVRSVERRGSLLEPRQRARRWLCPLAPQPVFERTACQVLHHDERALLPFADIEDGDRPGLPRKPRRREGFALEALSNPFVGREALGEHLHGHLAPQ
jgi:hypothetical protein